jgi:hypothetical protein
MAKKTRNVLLGLVLGVGVVLVALAVIVWRTPQPGPLPNPNGYDDFRRAGKMVTGKVGDFPDLDREALRALVETNAEPLRVLRLGLTRRCAVPADTAIADFAKLRDLACLKLLAQTLSAEGRLWELDNRPGDAAHSYSDAIQFGCDVGQGGAIINRLVGIACEAVGRSPLVKLVPKLSGGQIRPLLGELEQINSNEVSWEEVLRNENRLTSARIGPMKLVFYLLQAGRIRAMRSASEEKHELAVAQLRLLTVELALRCYRFEQGQTPGKLDLLVPKYLQRVPSDPFSGHALVYRPQGTNWLLYSVGPDRVDDGGKAMTRSNPGNSLPVYKGDLFYDSRW